MKIKTVYIPYKPQPKIESIRGLQLFGQDRVLEEMLVLKYDLGDLNNM